MMRFVIIVLLAIVLMPVNSNAQENAISAKTAGLQKIDGYAPLYWDPSSGKMLMEISRFNTEFLYQVSLQTGVGSNPIGLDRGQLGNTHVVFFERIGPKVLMIEPNYRYRAITNVAAERRAVEESFARSVLWGFKVEASDANRVLVDATAFFMRDAHGVIDRLRQTRQGQYRYDESRSAFYLPRTKGFPKNTEVETLLTFSLEGDPGPLVRETVPTAQAVTVREHHSIVELPDAGYTPRRLDPRVGVFGIDFYDYATPITEAIEQRWIARHRLQKRDPARAVSEPIKPIIYYVDNGTPEPVLSALIEGAAWWNEAYEAAGFRNAFQVRVLPADADPMDVRYNMINWVHRSTRGWAYGNTITDPRTGEIIKGNVTLDSLRARQDYLLATGLVPDQKNARGQDYCQFGMAAELEYLAALDPATDPGAMALARIRQLSAHEVGHTLGLAHNFAASTYGRASVMDYPAPMVEIRNGKLDLSNAYARGIGAYDKFAIRFAYSEFPKGANERLELERIITEGISAGMLFISDQDARPAGAAHPLANLWDNGPDPVAMLRHEMEVRRVGLSSFGLENIREGMPLASLEARLLPLYLHHRYQLQAAVKSLGGVYYTYAVRTAAGPSPARVRETVPAPRQREAMDAVLDTIDPDQLAIPARILELIPPRAFGYDGGTAELFTKRTEPVFDPIASATIAADLAISGLLQHQRAARLVEFHARDRANPDFKDVVDALMLRTWKTAATRDAYQAAIARAVQSLTVTRLMDLAANAEAAPQVRATATEALRELSESLKSESLKSESLKSESHKTASQDVTDVAHRRATRDDIERFLARPDQPRKQTIPIAPPPGDPIGSPARSN